MTASVETAKYRVRRRFYDRVSGRVYDSLAAIPRALEPDPLAIRAFLRIGYVPGDATLFRDVDCLPGGCRIEVDERGWRVTNRLQSAAPRSNVSRSAALEEGARLFVEAVRRGIRSGVRPLVPMSGGLDSRAILAALLEEFPASGIDTYTHGTPGSGDFEIGTRVARFAGTNHVTLNLDQIPFTEEALRAAAIWSDANTDLAQPSVWLHIARRLGTSAPQWTGFTGDGVGGSHFRGGVQSDAEAVAAFLREESGYKFLGDPQDIRDAKLVATQTTYDRSLSRHEAVWFANHVERYTAHHIFMNAFEFVNPFMDDAFVDFMLSLPPELRAGKRFYDEMMFARFPKLFALPTKGDGWRSGGFKQLAWRANFMVRKAAWRVAPGLVHHPMMSYLDFGYGLRERTDVHELGGALIEALAKRDVVDSAQVRQLWAEHQSGAKNHRYELTLLLSLEVALRVFSDESMPRSVSL
jgi:asparagine synthetase B (glutamine-hydrolysing)